MMKKSLIVASLLFTGTSAFSQDNGFEIIGISTGKVSTTQTVSVGTYSASDSTSDTIKILSIGKYITKSDIVSFSKSFVDTENNVDIDIMSLSYKYLLDIEQKNNIKLFVGGTYTTFNTTISGLQSVDSNYRSDSVSWDTNIMALDFGVRFTEIAKNLSANIGYSIGLSESGSGSVIYDITAVNFDYSNFKQWQIGLNYKF